MVQVLLKYKLPPIDGKFMIFFLNFTFLADKIYLIFITSWARYFRNIIPALPHQLVLVKYEVHTKEHMHNANRRHRSIEELPQMLLAIPYHHQI